MRKLLNTLYVNTQYSYLSKDGENIVVRSGDEEIFRIPIHNLEDVICIGYMGASPQVMQLCSENNVGLSYISPQGRFLARVAGKTRGNVLLRRTQYRIADDESASVQIAKNFIIGKIINCRSVLNRAIRDHSSVVSCKRIRKAESYLIDNLENIEDCNRLESLRGMEGNCAKAYFNVFDELILKQKDDFYFMGRNRRPPLDNMNALLSFLYALLALDIQSALEAVGLDPYVGFYHTDRPGRPSLALDMMEELRPLLVDRHALTLVNLQQIKKNDFFVKESGGVLMTDEGRKEVLRSWQKRKQEDIRHPYLNEAVPVGLIPYTQALLMARYLRGDLDEYPPFLIK